jgi:two-component system nitrogen regulation response regulator GlnG
MANEPWVLLGLRNTDVALRLKKSIQKMGLRSSSASSIEEGLAHTSRRTFIAAFFDPAYLHAFQKRGSFSSPTYLIAVLAPGETAEALLAVANGSLHEWLPKTFANEDVFAALQRARHYVRLMTELQSVRSETEISIRAKAELVCAGRFGKIAEKWVQRERRRDVPLLLVGELGCGKQILAHLLHLSGSRAHAPFVSVCCQDQNPEEFEKELFGEIPPRSRSTQTRVLRGRLSQVADGTLLLDKADHLSGRVQRRLAECIRTRMFSPIGGGEKIKLEARLIFSVREPGARKSLNKWFQRDLAKILKPTLFRVHSLRERREDLPEIVETGLRRIQQRSPNRSGAISEEALGLLCKESWPENLRQLETVLWAGSLLAAGSKITAQHVAPFLSAHNAEQSLESMVEEKISDLLGKFGVDHFKDLHPVIIEHVEKPLLRLVLEKTKGNQLKSAQILGINRNTLRRKMVDYKLASSS